MPVMRFVVPLCVLLLGFIPVKHDRIKVPGVNVTMNGSGKWEDDTETSGKAKRKGATIKEISSYTAELEGSLGLGATVTEFNGMKFTKERLRMSFAFTVWNYETDTETKQEILEEKETTFGPYPAYFLKMKVSPEGEDAYYFEAYSIAMENKEIFVSASYFDNEDAKKDLKDWTDTLDVDGHNRGEMTDIPKEG